MDLDELRSELADEHRSLDGLVADRDVSGWATPTPSAGWDVAHQIAHLTYFDGTATQAIVDPVEFSAGRDRLFTAVLQEGRSMDDATIGELVAMDPAELLVAWRQARGELLAAAGGLEAGSRVQWYGPSMGAASFLTARLMETWAHGHDVADALGVTLPATDRLRHIARLGAGTRGWSYANRGASEPDAAVRVSLQLPGGGVFEHGPADATDRVEGPAEDFCLVVTQRRHVDDTALRTTGAAAREWMELAQAFAGGPTDGPPPRSAA